MREDQSGKLPPGQQLLRPGRWPTVGEKPPEGPFDRWSLTVRGCVAQPQTLTLEQLLAEPQEEQAIDIHCVTRWSRLGVPFAGIPLSRFLAPELLTANAKFISFVARSDRGHSSSVTLEVARMSLLALYAEGKPLPVEYGGPLRVIVPGRYFYKSVKWLEAIEVLSEDQLGYWERDAGYHNNADPWYEERYLASGISKQQANRLIGIGADLEGANLVGANLSGADLTNASLFGADFVSLDDPREHAVLDENTKLSAGQISLLADHQEAFLQDKTTMP